MARPVKWSRDLHPIRERAVLSRTETWGRSDIERLFDVGRATAQTLMKAIGEVQPIGGAHFVERASLLGFLGALISAPDFDEALRARIRKADAPPSSKPLRVALPHDLRSVTVRDLPGNISLSKGRLEIKAESTNSMLESLALLAQAMQNDLAEVQAIIEPPVAPPPVDDNAIQSFLSRLRTESSDISQG
jgi:hypothetical protein